MCLRFDCNPQINVGYFFGSLDLVIFGLNPFRHWVSCERNLQQFNLDLFETLQVLM